MPEQSSKELRIKYSPLIHLKDKGDKGGVFFEPVKLFGFMPQVMSVQKIKGKNNTIVIGAVMQDEPEAPKILVPDNLKING